MTDKKMLDDLPQRRAFRFKANPQPDLDRRAASERAFKKFEKTYKDLAD